MHSKYWDSLKPTSERRCCCRSMRRRDQSSAGLTPTCCQLMRHQKRTASSVAVNAIVRRAFREALLVVDSLADPGCNTLCEGSTRLQDKSFRASYFRSSTVQSPGSGVGSSHDFSPCMKDRRCICPSVVISYEQSCTEPVAATRWQAASRPGCMTC